MNKMSKLLRKMTEIRPAEMQWAWEGLIPMGKLTLLTGGPGVGKSLVATQIAAMVSRGEATPFPQTAETVEDPYPHPDLPRRPRGVVILSADDSAEDTLLPRLVAAKAELSQVSVLRIDYMIVTETEDGSFSLTWDLLQLEKSVDQLAEAWEEVGLIVIDSIDRFFGPGDKKKDRIEAVGRLIELAGRTGAAVLVIANSSMKAGSRGGTVAYQELVNSARSVLMVGEDLDVQDQRLLLPVKLNLTAMQPGLPFTIVDGAVQWRDEPMSLTGADYQHQVQQTLKNPLIHEEMSELSRAIKWLKEELTPGRASSLWIQKGAGYVDISNATLRRAFKHLCCRATKVKNQWYWNLPGHPESASPELLEEPLESPEGELQAVFRESIPYWLIQQNAAEEEAKKQGAQTQR